MAAPPQSSEIPASPRGEKVTIKSYPAGFVLASVHTAIPFGLRCCSHVSANTDFVVIGVAAIIQVIAHLRYFLHLELKPSSQNRRIALCFGAVVLRILVGGTLGIMFDRYYRIP